MDGAIVIKCEEEEGKRDRTDDVSLCFPGEVVVSSQGYMPGYGTFSEGQDIGATLLGRVQRVNKLVCVNSIKVRKKRKKIVV